MQGWLQNCAAWLKLTEAVRDDPSACLARTHAMTAACFGRCSSCGLVVAPLRKEDEW